MEEKREERSKRRRRRRKRTRQYGCMMSLLMFLMVLAVGMGLMLKEKEAAKERKDRQERQQEEADAKKRADRTEEEDATIPGMSGRAITLEESIKEFGSNAIRQWSVAKPLRREWDEVLERLKELSSESTDIEQIYKNSSLYPEKLLEALANNPEMEYFVKYYPSFAGSTAGGLTEEEKQQAVPLFLQWDFRWGYQWYGDDGVIGLTGCGPTCLSMVLYSLTRDESLTPACIAKYAEENAYYINGIGTAWSLMWDAPEHYGVKVKQPRFTESSMRQELNDGHLIICSMGKGDFTTAGHFIVVYGYDEDGFLVNDPNCMERSGRRWPFAQLEKQIKNLWSFWN